jgi:APA family basic amino acid/polyamine antiporter
MVSEAESASGGPRLVRSFGVLQLTMISVGATLGTGILVILGESVPLAGPAIWISFAIAGLAALLSAVSYAEMAGLVPVAGSSYSYTYATMGEGMAWICGWCLVLEYAVSVAAVAVGAGQYVNEALAVFGAVLPTPCHNPRVTAVWSTFRPWSSWCSPPSSWSAAPRRVPGSTPPSWW